jgi:hypothetical protein
VSGKKEGRQTMQVGRESTQHLERGAVSAPKEKSAGPCR